LSEDLEVVDIQKMKKLSFALNIVIVIQDPLFLSAALVPAWALDPDTGMYFGLWGGALCTTYDYCDYDLFDSSQQKKTPLKYLGIGLFIVYIVYWITLFVIRTQRPKHRWPILSLFIGKLSLMCFILAAWSGGYSGASLYLWLCGLGCLLVISIGLFVIPPRIFQRLPFFLQ
jgi:hypothetical protein